MVLMYSTLFKRLSLLTFIKLFKTAHFYSARFELLWAFLSRAVAANKKVPEAICSTIRATHGIIRGLLVALFVNAASMSQNFAIARAQRW